MAGPAPSPVSLSYMGPPIFHVLGTLSMKVEYLHGAPPLVEPLTHTKLLTQVPTREFTQRRACMLAPIIYAHGLLHPLPWCGRHFSCRGAKV